jgi:hypothetical protein
MYAQARRLGSDVSIRCEMFSAIQIRQPDFDEVQRRWRPWRYKRRADRGKGNRELQ